MYLCGSIRRHDRIIYFILFLFIFIIYKYYELFDLIYLKKIMMSVFRTYKNLKILLKAAASTHKMLLLLTD